MAGEERLHTAVAVAWRANRRRGWPGAAIVAIALAVGIGLAVLAWIYTFQESLIFHPERLPAEHRFAFSDVSEVSIDVGGETLSALHRASSVTAFIYDADDIENPRGLVAQVAWLADTAEDGALQGLVLAQCQKDARSIGGLPRSTPCTPQRSYLCTGSSARSRCTPMWMLES